MGAASQQLVKILTKYVVREHIGPLLFASSALTTLLLLNTVAKQFGMLVGKGLSWGVIGEFFYLSIPYIVAMSLPMAVLVAVLYGFSRLAAENEITALRASGVSVVRMVTPVIVGGAVLALLMMLFNDQVLPRANHRLRTLQTDIARKKPTFALREQVINEVIPGRIFLRANHIDDATNRMREVFIYNFEDPAHRKTIYADSGVMGLTRDESTLEMTLHHGYVLQVPNDDPGSLQRLYFTTDLVRVHGVTNKFEKTEKDDFRSEREMTVCQMDHEYQGGLYSLAVARSDLATILGNAARAAATGVTPGINTLPPRESERTSGAVYCGWISAALGVFSKVGGSDDSTAEGRNGPPQGSRPTSQAGGDQPRGVPITPAPAGAGGAGGAGGAAGASGAVRGAAPAPVTREPAATPSGARSKLDEPQGSARMPNAVRLPVRAPKPAIRTPVAPPQGGVSRVTPSKAAPAAPVVRPPAKTPAGVTRGVGSPSPNRTQAKARAKAPAKNPAAQPARVTLPPVQSVRPAEIEVIKSRVTDARITMARYEVEIQKKFALSAACIVFVLFGAPLALRFPRGGVGLVIGVSILAFALYYVCLIAGQALAEKLIMNAFWSMWAANAIFTVIGVWALVRSQRVGATTRGGDLAEALENLRGWAARQARRVGIAADRRRRTA